jgi:soluble lytic murein transglycosylase-like protein
LREIRVDLWLSVPYPSNCQGNLASAISRNWRGLISGPEFLLKCRRDPAEITHMFFGITGLYFAARPTPPVPPATAVAWDGTAAPGEIGRPGDLPVPAGQQLRRWGALLALAGLALPGVSAARLADARPPAVPVVEASRTHAAGIGGTPPVPRATAAPWEAGVVEADGKPLPTAPPPGPVPVDGIPLPAVAAPVSPATAPPPATPTGDPAPGETVRTVPNQSAKTVIGPADDLVPADREYLRPILVRYAQENGLAADLLMSLAWVESSWRRNATSDAGAVGVMQIMPNTVEFVSRRLLGLRSNLDPRNPTSNVRMGAKYLRHLLDQNRGNVRQALIAYNQGLTSLRVNGSYTVAERYADRVLALRPQFRTA